MTPRASCSTSLTCGSPPMVASGSKCSYATVTGTVTELNVTEQQQVEVGVVLAVVTAEEDS